MRSAALRRQARALQRSYLRALREYDARVRSCHFNLASKALEAARSIRKDLGQVFDEIEKTG